MLCKEMRSRSSTELIKKIHAMNFLKSRGQFMSLRHRGSGCDNLGRSRVEAFTLVPLSHSVPRRSAKRGKARAKRRSFGQFEA